MKWFVRIAYAVFLSVFLFSAYSFVSDKYLQTSGAAEENTPPVYKEKNLKPRIEKTRLSLEEEFPRIKKIKETPLLNEKFEGIYPAKLSIPKAGIEADIEETGTLANGQMGVPADLKNAAWYEPGTKPGNKGNAVIDGHVDSKTGPAVFYSLKKLEKGDEVNVSDQNGFTLTYIVKELVSYPRDKAPLKEIFGETEKRNLNLITCTGLFNREQHTHEERLVVYTELAQDQQSQIAQKVLKPESPSNVKAAGSFISWYAVRNQNIIGYRVYKMEKNSGIYHQLASVSAYERKNIADTKMQADSSYYITAVDRYGQESAPSETVKGSGEE